MTSSPTRTTSRSLAAAHVPLTHCLVEVALAVVDGVPLPPA